MFDQKVGLIILVNKTLLLTQRIKILLFSESRIQCSFLRYTGLLTYFSSYRKERGDYWVNHCDLDDMVLCGCFFLGVLFLSTWLIGIATQIRDQLKTCVKKPHCSKEEMALTSCQHICFYISSMGVGGSGSRVKVGLHGTQRQRSLREGKKHLLLIMKERRVFH